jgi:hypothetical protein
MKPVVKHMPTAWSQLLEIKRVLFSNGLEDAYQDLVYDLRGRLNDLHSLTEFAKEYVTFEENSGNGGVGV